MPSGCFTVSWKVFRASDNQDMEVAMPSVFSVGATDLTFTHTEANYVDRLTLFGENDYYFQGTLDDSTSKTTS